MIIDSPAPRLGIITSGKSYLDVRQAFDDLGIDDALAAEIGIRLYKVGMVWPLEADGARRFAKGLDKILVVEEKRQLLEYQLKEERYNWREDARPRVIGKFDGKGEWARMERADGTRLAEAIARNYFKLLAYKDEYEVARRYTDPAFWEKVEATFDGDYNVRVHLAAPLLARPNPNIGHLAKRSFGAGMMRVFRLLARLKGLRGTRWHIVDHTAERRAERALIAAYEADVGELLDGLGYDRLPLALEIARLPEGSRGFGHVKACAMRAAAQQRRALLARWRAAPTRQRPPRRRPRRSPSPERAGGPAGAGDHSRVPLRAIATSAWERLLTPSAL